MGSVNEEITRIADAKAAIEEAIEYCGVDVPDGNKIDTYSYYIRAIPEAIFSQFNLTPVGGDNKYIKSISQTNGVIRASAGDTTSTVTENSTALITSGGVYSKVSEYLPLAGGTMTGTITSQNIIPTTNNTYSLGRPSLQWANVYATTFTGNLDGNAASATKLGSSTLGSTIKPIYLSGGTATECDTYAGGTAVTLNESSKASTTASFYAPTSVGTAGYLLKSNGSGAPSWTSTLGASNSYLSTSYIGNMYANALYLKSYYPTSGDIYISGFTTAPNSSNPVRLYTARYATIKNNNNSSTCAIYAPGGFYESSDERLKNISNPLQVNLDDIAKLRKIYYTWKDSPNGNQIGVIAQDVQKLYPELVDVDKETGLLSLAYDKLSVIALAAIDTLYDKIKTLEEKIDILWRK